MHDSKERAALEREKREAFEAQAAEFGFELRKTSFDVGEHIDIGLFFGPVASPVMDFDATGGEPCQNDDKRIKKCVKGWEKLHPTTYKDNYEQFATEEYLLLCGGGVGHIGPDVETEGNDAFAEALASYPVYNPRKVKAKKFQITHIGGMRAVATYEIREEFANGTSHRGNAVALLAKTDDGWRIFVATDHLANSSA